MTPMKTKLILFCALYALTIQSIAQTERESIGVGAPAGPSTPYVPPPSPAQQAKIYEAWKNKFFNGQVLRKVNGKIYNGLAWQIFSGDVYQKEDDILILSQKKYDYSRSPYPSTVYIAVKNFPGVALADQTVSVVAMPVGTYDMGGRPIASWDCGTPYIPPPPTPEQIKAAQEAAKIATLREKQKQFLAQSNAVVWLQSQATNGDASAQYSLGEHYLNGQGCVTNREQAIYWLTQAANQGNTEASNKLSGLKSP